jgi:hypothetical protein
MVFTSASFCLEWVNEFLNERTTSHLSNELRWFSFRLSHSQIFMNYQ